MIAAANSKTIPSLAAALAVAIVLRICWAWLVPVVPLSDSQLYDDFARSVAAGKGFAYPDGTLTAYWPVGTSAVYAALYRAFGVGFGPIVLLNIALGVSIVWLTWVLACRYFGERVGVLAAWIIACWPLLIQFTTILASELIFIVLLLLSLLLWSSRSLPSLVRGPLWGAVLAAAVFVRPTASPLFAILPALQVWHERSWRGALTSGVLALMVAGLMFVPWVARNLQVVGGFSLVSTNFGPNLWMGNNPQSEGGYMPLPERQFANEVARDTYYKRAATDFITNNPMTYIELCAKRLIMTYGRESVGVAWNATGLATALGGGSLLPVKLLANMFWWIVLGVCIAGLVTAARLRSLNLSHPLLVVGFLFFLVPILTVGQDRYHMPLIPFFAIAAALTVASHRFTARVTG